MECSAILIECCILLTLNSVTPQNTPNIPGDDAHAPCGVEGECSGSQSQASGLPLCCGGCTVIVIYVNNDCCLGCDSV